MVVQSQPAQIVTEILFEKNPTQKMTGGVAQGVGPEFKSQYLPFPLLSYYQGGVWGWILGGH
jgi:hypothetical protein